MAKDALNPLTDKADTWLKPSRWQTSDTTPPLKAGAAQKAIVHGLVDMNEQALSKQH